MNIITLTEGQKAIRDSLTPKVETVVTLNDFAAEVELDKLKQEAEAYRVKLITDEEARIRFEADEAERASV